MCLHNASMIYKRLMSGCGKIEVRSWFDTPRKPKLTFRKRLLDKVDYQEANFSFWHE